VVIGGLAVGVAIGTALRKVFGTARAIRAEEAAVEGALILRRAREALEDELGRPLTQPEVKQMFGAYTANLVQLGFEQQANGQWYRPRSAIERLLG
jgi:hypothetical protein